MKSGSVWAGEAIPMITLSEALDQNAEVWGSLLSEYEDFFEACARFGYSLEEVYNHTWLHSALDYRPLVECEPLQK
jgi:hypothetical protein